MDEHARARAEYALAFIQVPKLRYNLWRMFSLSRCYQDAIAMPYGFNLRQLRDARTASSSLDLW